MCELLTDTEDRENLSAEAQAVRDLNDNFRRTFVGGAVLVTPGVEALDIDIRKRALATIRSFEGFCEDNDPYGTHEFGGIEIEGTRVWFKIDCYDETYQYASPDPTDPAVTRRVMTILLPEEH